MLRVLAGGRANAPRYTMAALYDARPLADHLAEYKEQGCECMHPRLHVTLCSPHQVNLVGVEPLSYSCR